MTMEMGKPIKQALAEIDKCASHIDYYIANSHSFIEDEELTTKYSKAIVVHQPLGVLYCKYLP